MKINYYGIRHIATKQLMPEFKRGRGYSHWNPSVPNKELRGAFSFPRLLESKRSAERAIVGWWAYPNSRNDFEGDMQIGQDDGRKKEDLEIIQICVKIKGPNDPYWEDLNEQRTNSKAGKASE